MCGLVGIWHLNKEPVDTQLLRQMTDCINHRGPDDEGHLIDGNLGLGSRRLSIIDLSPAGHMPMPNEDKTVWIIYNGEVYNYLELSGPLKAKGHQFRSQTDTEIVLHAYETYGPDCLNYFNGMWAFVIWDQNQQLLFCAVDRFGIKPFHYYFDGQIFIFGSEIKSILLHPRVPKHVNPQAVYDYLALSHIDHNDETFFAGIKRLPGAHYLTLKATGHLSVTRWWDIDLNVNPYPIDEKAAVEQFSDLFQDSVRLRLRSDVPVGTCLSGGLDSSSIVSVANQLIFGNNRTIDSKLVGEQQKTFSACYNDTRFDERSFIEAVINKTGAETNYVFPDGGDPFWADIPDLIWHQEEPFASTSIYAQWNVMRRVSQRGVKVVLDGQGADELLAGYPKYPAFYMQQLIRTGQISSFLREFLALREVAKERTTLNLTLVAYLILPWWIKSFVSGLNWHFKGRHSLKILQDDFRHNFSGRKLSLAEESRSQFQQNLTRKLYSDMTTFMLPALLRHEDRNSMAFSVESRVPFLDYRLVEFVFSLPQNYRVRNGWSKWILRQAMPDLPEKIRWRRDKMGFVTPEMLWLRAAQSRIRELLANSNARSSNYLNSQEVLVRLDADLAKPGQSQSDIWRWINLELWMERFNLN
ncbi:asparagine synthase (glutamine-hydrolyzing) [Chloroflexota bacterium]